MVDAVHVGVEFVQQAQPEVGVGLAGLACLVAQVVGEPGEAVQRGQVPPVHGREHAQRDGEVLPGGVGHHLFGARHPRADVLAHAGPVRFATAPGNLVIFQGMHI